MKSSLHNSLREDKMKNRMLWIGLSAFALALMPGLPLNSAVAQEFKACQVTDTGGIDDKSFRAPLRIRDLAEDD